MRGERRRAPRATGLGDVLGSRLREHTAPLVWAELVGPQIAAATDVDNVKDGVLYVHTRSSMWTQELTFHKADILRRLNARIGARPGEPLIREIRFQNRGVRRHPVETAPALHPTPEELDDVDLSPGETDAIDTGIAIISDDTLRARMRKLRIADCRLRTWRLDNGWAPCPHCGDLAPPAFPANGALACSRCRVIPAYPQQ
jgi:predicted nucleic acid-binding Zn ribbon protein